MTTDDTPRVWVGCLACYNAGRLAGDWFDATDCPTQMTGEGDESWNGRIDEREVKVHPDHYREGHDELWVMDHENFHGALSGECSPSEAQELAEAMTKAAEDTHAPMAAVGAYIDYAGDRDLSDFAEAYAGEWDDEEDYARDLAESIGAPPREFSWPASYIDWESATRDLFSGDYWSARAPGDGVFVFRSV